MAYSAIRHRGPASYGTTNRDQLRNPTLGNQVRATFTFFTRVSQCQKGKTSLGFTEARDSEWQWHQLGHMLVCTSPQQTKLETKLLYPIL